MSFFDNTQFFSGEEGTFASPDSLGSWCKCDEYTLYMLEALRWLTGKPFHINSGYRTAAHNAQVGGAPNSAHSQGLAVDVSTTGWTSVERLKFISDAKRLGFRGVGVAQSYIHIDRAQRVAMWRYEGQKTLPLPEADLTRYV